MKYFLILTALLFLNITIKANGKPESESTEANSETIIPEEDVKINTKMIERFNNATLPEGYVTFNTLTKNKSLHEIKSVIAAYQDGTIETLTAENIKTYEEENNIKSGTIILLSENALE